MCRAFFLCASRDVTVVAVESQATVRCDMEAGCAALLRSPNPDSEAVCMMRSLIAGLVCLSALPVHAANLQCQGVVAQMPAAGPTVLAPVAVEFLAANPQLGSQRGVLAP